MTQFVLDASVTMAWLLGNSSPAGHAYAAGVLEAMKSVATRAAVPAIWSLEVANVIVRAEGQGVLSEAQSDAFLEMLADAGIHADEATASRAMTDTLHVARRYRLSAYDAAYLDLALRTGLPLATLDADLAAAARRAGVRRFSV